MTCASWGYKDEACAAKNVVLKIFAVVIPKEGLAGGSFRVKWSSGRAGTVSDLAHLGRSAHRLSINWFK